MISELKDLMLQAPRLTLAVAESLTSGLVQAKVGGLSGASLFYFGGITAYSLDQKVRHLGVNSDEAAPVNCVSQGVAEQMARGICALFHSDIGLATTGYAEPTPEWQVEEPFAWWAVAHRQPGGGFVLRSDRVVCPGMQRGQTQECVTETALSGLVGYLKELRAKERGA